MVDGVSKDLYARLGLARDADAAGIKAAHRKAVMGCHPDKFPGDVEKGAEFLSVQEAYDVLSDEKRRAAYDLTGEIEGDDEARVQAEARESFISLLTNVISLMDDPVNQSPLMRVREQIATKRVEAKTLIDHATRLRQKTEIAVSRLTRTVDGADPVGRNLEKRLQNLSKDLSNMHRMFKVLDAMEGMLGEYRYRVDASGFGYSQPRPSSYFGGTLPVPDSRG